MKNKHDTARSALMIIVCILIIGSTSVLFISQMNGMVQNNIMNTISELAEHDLVSIQNFVETEWNDLYNIHKCLEVYDCDTILEIQERMNLERATSDFHTIYLVAEDGTVYTDRYMVYPKEKNGMIFLRQRKRRRKCSCMPYVWRITSLRIPGSLLLWASQTLSRYRRKWHSIHLTGMEENVVTAVSLTQTVIILLM